MAIIFAGCDPVDFVPTEGSTTTTSAQYAPYLSLGIELDSQDVVQTYQFDPQTDFWVSFYLFAEALGTESVVSFRDADGQVLFDIKGVTDDSKQGFELRAYDGEQMQTLDTGPVDFSTNTLLRFDVHFVIDGSDGLIEVYVDRTLYASFSGDTDLVSSDGVADILFKPILANNSGDTTISAVIVADEDTRAMYVTRQLPQSGSSPNSDWDGGGYSAIDDNVINDSDGIGTQTIGATHTFPKAGLPSALAGYDVVAVILSGRMSVGGPSADVKATFYSQATGTVEGERFHADAELRNRQAIHHINPATEQPWTFSEADSSHIGVKLVDVSG